jgi:hypothetical protein
MLCFPFFATFKVNFLRLVADLKKGKWGKNISEQAANSTEKYLHMKGKIEVITFLQNKIFIPLDIIGK